MNPEVFEVVKILSSGVFGVCVGVGLLWMAIMLSIFFPRTFKVVMIAVFFTALFGSGYILFFV